MIQAKQKSQSSQGSDTIMFSLLTRGGKKPIVHSINLDTTSIVVQNA